jgi:hydrogenase maturation protease
MRTIVLGVGNPILRDDGVGIHVARRLKCLVNDPDVTVDEAFTGGMNLLDMIVGYDRAILIDAVKMKEGRAGDVGRFLLEDVDTFSYRNPHDASLLAAIRYAQKIGEGRIPKEIVIIGITIKETTSFGEELSPKVLEAIPRAIEVVMSELHVRGSQETCDSLI